MAWYNEWFGEEYLELYSHRDESEADLHADFVQRELGPEKPRAVLDLACGAGRHTAALRRRHLRTLGVDLSLTLLVRMAENGLPRVAGDMRCLPFRPASFDWVLNFFTSFGYFETERENFRVLEEIVRILSPGGRFLIDLLNPSFAIAHLKPRETRETARHRLEIERWYDAASHRINKRIDLISPEGTKQSFRESVRAYGADEVVIGLRWAGLEVDRLCGDFLGSSYDRDSERLILIGHKPR
ncbi:MAG TPA: methyltransferase domain-containing protein [Thermoanaerobaculia bacterium]|nr:methyltransferase domain-containing protein [Thermoanaerobaculia bacterium]